MNAVHRARRIKMLVLDVDGVLTDGGLHYDAAGTISKRFFVQDGLGIKLAQSVGLEVAVITGLVSDAVETRVRELGIKEYHDGHTRKIPLINKIARSNSLELSELAYMGDDWVDAGPMSIVGLAMAVSNAQPEIIRLAHWVSESQGGYGAVREGIAFILKAQQKYDDLWKKWIS